MDFVLDYYVQEQKKKVAINYMADMLRFTVFNTADGEQRYTVSEKLKDLLEPRTEETRTPEEIIDNIKQKLAQLGE